MYTGSTSDQYYSEMSSKNHFYEGYVEYTGPFDQDWMEYQQLDLYSMFETTEDRSDYSSKCSVRYNISERSTLASGSGRGNAEAFV